MTVMPPLIGMTHTATTAPPLSLKMLRAQAMKRRLEGAGDDRSVPICVDLDDTLIRSNAAQELLLSTLRVHPWRALHLIAMVLLGRAGFRNRVWRTVTPDPAATPFRGAFLRFLRDEQGRGRSIVLISNVDFAFAQAVARYLGGFSDVIAMGSSGYRAQARMARVLCNRFGAGQFDYAGHAKSAMPLWQTARRAIIVAPSARLLRHKAWKSQDGLILGSRPRTILSYIEATRPRLWAMNALAFLPILASPDLANIDTLVKSYLTFCVFCLITSAGCVVNDIADLYTDRQHPAKQKRALPSGSLPVHHSLVLATSLAVLGLGIAAFISPLLCLCVLGFLTMSLGYSFWLKRILLADVITLTCLYLAPIVAGGIATAIPLSPWLLIFWGIFLLGLALLHRYSELKESDSHDRERVSRAIAYTIEDAPMMASLGIAAGFVSALVAAFYTAIATTSGTFRLPALLWLVCPLLIFWTAKIWISAGRGEAGEDATTFAISAPISRLAVLVGALIYFIALLVQVPAMATLRS
jgi:4-hydroxybenzoate polyprenyltransferase